MASYEKRGKGYRITVSLGRNIDGTKKVVHTIYYPKATTEQAIKKEVDAFAYSFEARVKDGEYYSGEKLTLQEFIFNWYSQYAEKTVSLRVREEYRATLERFFLPVLGTMKLSKIRAIHIQEVLSNMNKCGLSYKTIRNNFTPINSVMTFAFKQGLIKENPCLRCTLPKSNPDGIIEDNQEEPLHFFNVDQTNSFLNFLEKGYDIEYPERVRKDKNGNEYSISGYTVHHDIDPQFIAYFYLAIYGGFRLGEMCALKWKDVDWDNRIITIQKSVSKTKSNGQIVKCPKTKASYRSVSLPPVCFEKLETCREAQKNRMEELGSLWAGKYLDEFDKNYVFIKWKDGSRIDIDTPGDKFKKLIEIYNSIYENKLPKIRLHDLRHTSATLLIAQNINIETISKRLGHSKTSTTLNIYGHAMPEKDTEAANVLGTIINPSRAKNI